MRQSRYVMLAALVAFAVAGWACTQKAADKALDATKEGTATAIDETRKAGESLADATRNAAERTADKAEAIASQTADKTTEIAGDVATKTKELSATTGEVITDAWITTKLHAQFLDEAVLTGSHINVDTDNHVVTLRGTVASVEAKDRAAAIARETEGVTRVVNQLVVQ